MSIPCILSHATSAAHFRCLVDLFSFPCPSPPPHDSYVLFCITIVVVAVPEGLPLAVTLSLAYSVMKMMADNNLVRYLAACETMGSATTICSDKTGTLTENKMTVTEMWVSGAAFAGLPVALSELGAGLAEQIVQNLALNSRAFLTDESPPRVIGSRTEGALLALLAELGRDYRTERKAWETRRAFPFNSTIKMSAAVIDRRPGGGDGLRVLVKGAPDRVLAM